MYLHLQFFEVGQLACNVLLQLTAFGFLSFLQTRFRKYFHTHMPYGRLIVQVPCTYAKLVNLVSRLLKIKIACQSFHFCDCIFLKYIYVNIKFLTNLT